MYCILSHTYGYVRGRGGEGAGGDVRGEIEHYFLFGKPCKIFLVVEDKILDDKSAQMYDKILASHHLFFAIWSKMWFEN